MKRLCMMMLALCAAVSTAYCGTTYYLKPGATDLSVKESYTTGSAGGAAATEPPGAADEVVVPAGTFAIAGGSTSFTTLSGVKRVRPENGAVLEITVGDNDTQTFEAPVNWNGESYVYNSEGNIKGYGKIVKKGNGTLILASSGNTKYNSYNQDYFTGLEIVQGTLKMPQYAVGNMYFGDVAISNGAKLVTCGDLNDSTKGTQTLVLTLAGYGTITNETDRESQAFSTIGRDIVLPNEFHGSICHPVRLWLEGSLRQYGHETGIKEPVVVQNNNGWLNNGYARGVYSFEDPALLGPKSFVQYYGTGAGLHYFGGEDATFEKQLYIYCTSYPVFFDAGWHGGLRLTGTWFVMGDSKNKACQKWMVLTGTNAVPCTIEGNFSENTFSDKGWQAEDGIPYTIVVQKLGSGTWRLKNTRSHGGGFAIEEGTLQFDRIDEKGMLCSLGLSTNLTDLTTERDLSGHRKDYAFTLGSTKASAPEAVFEYMGRLPAVCTTRPLVLVGKGGNLRASDGRLTFGGISARDANATPTLTLSGSGTATNVVKNISDGKPGAKVSVAKEGSGTWALAGEQTFSGDITVKQGALAIRRTSAQYADYKWFRLSIAQIGPGGVNEMRIRQISLFDKDGVRQNAGLTLAGPAETSDGLVLAATNIAPGQAYYDRSAAGKTVVSFQNTEAFPYGTLAYAFDGIYSGGSGGCFTIRWKSGSSNCNPSPSNRSTWIPIVMHLPDSANPVTHFDIVGINRTADTSNGYMPTRVMMEGSHDGFVWEELYSNVDTSKPLLAQNNTTWNQWISDGGDTEAVANRSRPIDKGCLLSKSGDVERRYFSWFRLSIAELGDNSGNNNTGDDNAWNVRQIGLYDRDGNRLNKGLVAAEGVTAAGNQTHAILGTVPQPGQVGFDASAAGNKVKISNAGGLNLNFDDIYEGGDGGANTYRWRTASEVDLVPKAKNRMTWIPIVMRLDGPAALDHFDIETMNNNDTQSPKRFMLEGSADGEDWYVLYDNATTGAANAIEPSSYNWWLSDGIQAKKTSHARLEGEGFPVSMSYVPDSGSQFPNGVNAQVLSGATLRAEGVRQTIKTLKVDSAGAGTLDGFTFAENGTIDVTFADAFPQTAALPGTYVNCEGLENVARWNIKVNGSPSGKYRVSVKDGAITFVVRGLTISFR